MSTMTRSDAMILVKNLIPQLRKGDRSIEADALELVLCCHPRDDKELHFNVAGAGELEVSASHTIHRCGKAKGIGIGCSWGQWGYAGGVMDREDMKALMNHFNTFIRKTE